MPPKTRRAALYARLSLTTEESVSIARQIEAGRRYAEARGLEVVLEAVDDGVSATRKAPEARPGWQSILERAPDLDVVIVWKVDRLARRVLDFLNADRALQAHGAGLVAVEDPIDMTTAQGRAFATVLAVFGEMEAAAISSRAVSARAHLISVERAAGGRRPWPYEAVPDPDGAGVKWIPIPERADAIRWAAEETIAGRTSLRRIMDEWERRGLPTKEGRKKWARTTISRILRNPVLAGATTHHGQVVRNPDQTIRISPERVILDLATFLQLQEALADRSNVRDPIVNRIPTIVGDLLHCSGCKHRMHQNRTRGRAPRWVCHERHCPEPTAVNHDIILPIAERVLLETAGDWRVTEAAPPVPSEVDPVEVALIEDALEDVELALAAPDLEDDEGLRLLRARRDLRVRLAGLRDRADTPARPVLIPLHQLDETYAERWARADDAEKARLMESVFAAIEVSPGVRGTREQPEERFRFVESLR